MTVGLDHPKNKMSRVAKWCFYFLFALVLSIGIMSNNILAATTPNVSYRTHVRMSAGRILYQMEQ